MTTTHKILAVRYNSYRDWAAGKNTHLPDCKSLTAENDVDLKNKVVDLLFENQYSYVLVKHADKFFHIEKDSDTSYCKKQIIYHPLIDTTTNEFTI